MTYTYKEEQKQGTSVNNIGSVTQSRNQGAICSGSEPSISTVGAGTRDNGQPITVSRSNKDDGYLGTNTKDTGSPRSSSSEEPRSSQISERHCTAYGADNDSLCTSTTYKENKDKTKEEIAKDSAGAIEEDASTAFSTTVLYPSKSTVNLLSRASSNPAPVKKPTDVTMSRGKFGLAS